MPCVYNHVVLQISKFIVLTSFSLRCVQRYVTAFQSPNGGEELSFFEFKKHNTASLVPKLYRFFCNKMFQNWVCCKHVKF